MTEERPIDLAGAIHQHQQQKAQLRDMEEMERQARIERASSYNDFAASFDRLNDDDLRSLVDFAWAFGVQFVDPFLQRGAARANKTNNTNVQGDTAMPLSPFGYIREGINTLDFCRSAYDQPPRKYEPAYRLIPVWNHSKQGDLAYYGDLRTYPDGSHEVVRRGEEGLGANLLNNLTADSVVTLFCDPAHAPGRQATPQPRQPVEPVNVPADSLAQPPLTVQMQAPEPRGYKTVPDTIREVALETMADQPVVDVNVTVSLDDLERDTHGGPACGGFRLDPPDQRANGGWAKRDGVVVDRFGRGITHNVWVKNYLAAIPLPDTGLYVLAVCRENGVPCCQVSIDKRGAAFVSRGLAEAFGDLLLSVLEHPLFVGEENGREALVSVCRQDGAGGSCQLLYEWLHRQFHQARKKNVLSPMSITLDL